ncbi:MAG: tail protein X [Cohaesibacter sp.]|jgi:hypothetical protein|nr:tail protein X [Cohaesibacter sp.]
MSVKTKEYFNHLTQTGERWDVIAWRYYKDPEKQDLLIEENRHLFLDNLDPVPAILPTGTKLCVPVIEQASINDALLPPWKRGLNNAGGT